MNIRRLLIASEKMNEFYNIYIPVCCGVSRSVHLLESISESNRSK